MTIGWEPRSVHSEIPISGFRIDVKPSMNSQRFESPIRQAVFSQLSPGKIKFQALILQFFVRCSLQIINGHNDGSN